MERSRTRVRWVIATAIWSLVFSVPALRTARACTVETAQAGGGSTPPLVVQSTTRRPTLELSRDTVARDHLDFTGFHDHVRRHLDATAGSGFSRELFPNAEALETFLRQNLPEQLTFDVDGRIELTLTFPDRVIGTEGIVSRADLERLAPGTPVHVAARMPGGTRGTIEEGGVTIHGTWYPRTNPDGSVNPRAQFTPDANLAFADAAPTSQLTLIIDRNNPERTPRIVTAFPGRNAPPVPTILNNAEGHPVVNTTGPNSGPSRFWAEHVFLQQPLQFAGGRTLRVTAAESTALQRAKFASPTSTPEMRSGVFESRITRWGTPEALMRENAIATAFRLLNPLTSTNAAAIPETMRTQLAALGVTVREYAPHSDARPGRLVLTYTVPEGQFVGTSGLLERVPPHWQRGVRVSSTGFTGTPTVPMTSQPTREVNLVFTTEGNRVQLRDAFAGPYAPSGPPTEIARLMTSGRARDVRRRLDEVFTMTETERPEWARHWSRAQVEESVTFWQTHALATGPAPAATALSGPGAPALPNLTAPHGTAPRTEFLTNGAAQHVLRGEPFTQADGRVVVMGGHAFDIVASALAGNTHYQLERVPITAGAPEAPVLRTPDGKQVMKGFYAPNPDGTFRIRYRLRLGNNADGTPLWSGAHDSTVFPPSWTAGDIHAAARVLAATAPREPATGQAPRPDGLTSHVGVFDGIAIQMIRQGDQILTMYPLGGRAPAPLHPVIAP